MVEVCSHHCSYGKPRTTRRHGADEQGARRRPRLLLAIGGLCLPLLLQVGRPILPEEGDLAGQLSRLLPRAVLIGEVVARVARVDLVLGNDAVSFVLLCLQPDLSFV